MKPWELKLDALLESNNRLANAIERLERSFNEKLQVAKPAPTEAAVKPKPKPAFKKGQIWRTDNINADVYILGVMDEYSYKKNARSEFIVYARMDIINSTGYFCYAQPSENCSDWEHVTD